jgi:leucine dehydrogenase
MSFMNAFDLARELGHEELLFFQDRDSGLRGVIAIHDTSLGPAAGGTRMRPYPSLDAAAVDALRLSRAMTYKAALAEVDRGGGKAVIVGDEGEGKGHALLAAYARTLDRLGGRFHTGPDMGFHGQDVADLARLSPHVSHAPPHAKVDTADLTALGVLESIRSAAAAIDREIAGLHVAVQGLGEVGSRLCRLLHAEGARLTVADVDATRTERVVAETGAQVVDPQAVYDVDADVFSPNAAGGVLRDETIGRLRCQAVVGAANEQLLEARHGDVLDARGILYAPDYVVNAGGLLSLFFELGQTDEEGVVRRVREIGPRVEELLAQARREGVAPHRVADRLAEERLAEARKARRSV